jgi:hypothetical protein
MFAPIIKGLRINKMIRSHYFFPKISINNMNDIFRYIDIPSKAINVKQEKCRVIFLWESNALLALVELFHSLAHGKRCGCTLYLSSSSSSIVVVLLRKDGRVSRSDSFAQNNFIWLRDTVKITPGEAAQDNFIWVRDCQMRTIIWLILPSVYVFTGSSATLKFLKKVSDHTHTSPCPRFAKERVPLHVHVSQRKGLIDSPDQLGVDRVGEHCVNHTSSPCSFTGSVDGALRYGSDAQCWAGTTTTATCGSEGGASRRFSTSL